MKKAWSATQHTKTSVWHIYILYDRHLQHRWNRRTDSHYYVHKYINNDTYKTYMLNMKRWAKMNLYSDPIQRAVVRNRRSKSKETHYTRASVAASLDAHFLFLSSPTHTLFLWRPLKSPTRLCGCLLPHSSALLRFTHCSLSCTSSSPASQWYPRAEVPHALAWSWKRKAHHVWWHECTS